MHIKSTTLFVCYLAAALMMMFPAAEVSAKAFVHGIKINLEGEDYYLDGPADGANGAKDIPGHEWHRAGPTRLVGKQYNTGPFGAPKWWSSDARDGAFLYNVHGIIDTWSEEKAQRYSSRGFVYYHELVRATDGRPHPDKVVWIKHTARARFTLDGGPEPGLGHAVRPGIDYEFLANWTTPHPSLEKQVAVALWGDVFQFELVQLDMAALAQGLAAEAVVNLPAVAAGSDEVVSAALPSRIVYIRPDLELAYLKTERPEQAVEVTEVALPAEQNYRLGDCMLPERVNQVTSCGAVTIFDPQKTMVGGMLILPDIGVSFFEPVDMILGGRENPGLHVVYNSQDTVNPITDDEEPPLPPEDPKEIPTVGEAIIVPLTSYYATQIVLDGDRQFYNIDPSTVWTRMDAVYNNVDVIYTLIEPLSFDWSLDMSIKGMEVWVAGGPTTTNKVDLTNELTDPGYLLIHPVTDQEIHFFSVGYNVSGVYGRAAGIGYAGSSAIGGGTGQNHAYAEALTTQSLKTKWVVAAHEIGHLIGGQHGDGALASSGECAGGFLTYICAPSLMPAGSAGAPDGRSPFFSNANDANIIGTLNAVLP